MWGTALARRRALALAAAVATTALAAPADAVVVERGNGAPAGARARDAATTLAAALPQAVAQSSAARVDGQIVAPTLAPVGDHLSAVGALGNPTVAANPAGGFALDTPRGAVKVAPVFVDSAASTAAIVNGDSAVFAGIQSQVDALLRPTAVGVATVLSLRDQLAPETIAWSVQVPRGETLKALPDGSVAVGAGDSAQASRGEAAASTTGIADPAALTDPAAQYSDGRSAARDADAATARDLVAVIQPPQAADASGRPVPTRLEVKGDVVTVAIDHHEGGHDYPIAVATSVTAPDSWERPWREAPGTGPAQPGPDGLLKVRLPDGQVLLTHGPDRKKPGQTGPDEGLFDPELDNGGTGTEDPVEDPDAHTDGLDAPSRSTTPGDVGLPPVPGGDPVCASRGKKRLQVMYSSSRALDDEFRPFLTRRIRRIVKGMNVKLYGEGLDSGSENTPRRLKVVCEPSGRISVEQFVTTGSSFEDVVSEAKAAGATDGNTKYLIFEEGANPGNDDEFLICGEGNMYDDERASARNLNNGRKGEPLSGAGTDSTDGDNLYEGGYAVVYGHPDGEEGCWNVDNAMHENGHTMGAVQNNAPASTTRTHCDDGLDVMCYDDREQEDIDNGVPDTYREDVCPPGPRGARYDCNYDTYFDARPEDGEYLDDNWNIGTQENVFLNFSKPPRVDEAFVFAGGDEDTATGGIFRETDDDRERPVVIAGNHECGEQFCLTPEEPALSPDAQQVAFIGQGSSNVCFDLRLMDADGGDKHSIWKCAGRENEFATRPSFSPSGRTVVYDDAADVWTMSLYGTELRRVVDWGQVQYQASFSPDGQYVLFTSEGTPNGTRFEPDPVAFDRSAIYRVDRDGANPVKLTDHSEFVRMSHARYSPDGTQIAFEGTRVGEQFNIGVYVMDADGTNVRVLSPTDAWKPTWTTQGEVAFSEFSADNTWDVVAMRPDGTGHRTLVGDLSFASAPSFRQPSPLYYP